jgi:hypothetical protein
VDHRPYRADSICQYKLHASLVSTSKLDRILALSVPVIVQH